MNKNILIISASPRKGGNSDYLCDRFMAGAQESGHDVEKIFLRKKKISCCIACYQCKSNDGLCAIKDDVPEIIDKIIVWAVKYVNLIALSVSIFQQKCGKSTFTPGN